MPARILVIEDNPASLELMTYLLTAFGYTTEQARDGAEGLESIRGGPPDLIVCDIHLPEIDGYEVAKRLKADPALRAIPLVAVTALAMVGDRAKVLAAGFDGYITKPIVPLNFVAQLETFLPAAQRNITPDHSSAPTTAKASAPLAGRGPRILVVDDLPSNIDIVRSTLEPLGYQVFSASNANDGLALAGQVTPDLIVSDVHMPGIDGFGFIRLVKSSSKLQAIPFIFLASTPTTARAQKEALGLGAARFILRPIEPQALLDVIEECVGPTRTA